MNDYIKPIKDRCKYSIRFDLNGKENWLYSRVFDRHQAWRTAGHGHKERYSEEVEESGFPGQECGKYMPQPSAAPVVKLP